MKTSHLLLSTFFASTATTIHCEPNFWAPSFTILESFTAAVFIETLSAPELRRFEISLSSFTPPPTVKGTKQFSEVFLTTSKIISLFSFDAVMSKKQISSAPFSL